MDSVLYAQYNIDNAVGSLTQLQKSLLLGTVLGDGYIRKFPGRKNALLEINHSFNQREYVDWKYKILENISASQPKSRNSNKGRIAYRFYTKQLPEISQLMNLFYRNGKKTIPDNINLDPISLAVWYMDDGSQCRDCDVYLNTQQFDLKDQIKLIAYLKELGLEARMNKDKNYYRLRFIKSSIPKLKEFIKNYIVPSMLYKIEL